MIGRVLRTGLSSLRDRAANLRCRLAALRFNPSRCVGYAMMALPFAALLAFDFVFLRPLQAVVAILVPLAFAGWMLLAVRLIYR